MNEASRAARLLGRMNKGVKKNCTPEDREARRQRVAKAREKLAEMRSRKEAEG